MTNMTNTPPPVGPVAIVTDSTASFPPGVAEAAGITVVPLYVVLEGESHREGVDVSPEQIAKALTEGAQVSTSQPTREQFARAYSDLAARGAHEIVSVHLSGDLSGTVHTAAAAGHDAAVPVHVVDSRTAAMGLGFAARAAARVVAEAAATSATETLGASPAATMPAVTLPAVTSPAVTSPAVTTSSSRGTPSPASRPPVSSEVTLGRRAAEAASEASETMRAVFLVDSIEHLRRGGRLGRAASTLGTLLGLRPLLTITEGRIDVLAKVRTRAGAIARVHELACAHAHELRDANPSASLQIAVHHIGDDADARALADLLAADTGADVVVSSLSAVLGAHVGPGMLATIVGDGSPT